VIASRNAALLSWAFDWRVILLLLTAAFVYVRGWLRGRPERDSRRLAAFLGGLAVLFVALESPLDAFDSLFLSAHMVQHLLLMTFAPLLLLLGEPAIPLLRGLPKGFVREGLGPFLAWPLAHRALRWLSLPPVAWLAFALSTVFWHVPSAYELALRQPFWHALQHACFFWTGVLFWWPVVLPKSGRRAWPPWSLIPYLLLADGLNTALAAFFVFSDRLLYPSYELVRITGMTAREDQAAAGAIMWVPGSLAYVVSALVIGVRLFAGPQTAPAGVRRTPRLVQIAMRPSPPVSKRLVAWRKVVQAVMLLVAIAVMADGFTGSPVAPRNLAGTLPWIHWRALSVLALLLVGNLFCMVCPFTLVRDCARLAIPAALRARLRWPRPLRNKWLPIGLIVVYLWAYEAFSLWNSPWMTAWIITGYFAMAVLVDGIFRGASFCKYVCPIGQFQFIGSLVSAGEIRVRDLAVCQSCRTYDCIRGNDRARGCELNLFQPKKAGNADCTFCLDCVKACPRDNVGFAPVAPAATLTIDPHRSSIGRLSKRTDLAALALLIVFGAFVNAAGMVEPVMMWEHRWHAHLGPHTMPAIVAGFVLGGACFLPAMTVLVCGAFNRVVAVPSGKDVARRFVFALIPLGLAMWAAHLLYHAAAAWNAALSPTPAQFALLDAGLLLTLYVSWRVARQHMAETKKAIALMLPWALLSCGLYAAGVWVFLQPMQMRGVMP
jgi:cytochrome c oxidase assembly factor CtaG/polyferredoxin